MTVYISPNPGKEQAADTARRAAQLLLMQGAVVLMQDDLKESCYVEGVQYLPLEECLPRTDERVVNMERTNIRNVTLDMLAEPIEFFSVDVSFISLHHIFPVAQAITTPDAMGVCLVKPQFEAGREKVGKNGVVRDPATHREVLHNAMGYAAANGFVVRGLDFSPVKGPEGNIEYLMFVQKSEQPGVLDDSVAEQVVAASHSSLDK